MSESQAWRLGLAAGELSGDLLASSVLSGLRERLPGLTAGGIGGDYMRAEGFDPWWHIDELSVRGYVEVLRAYPRLRRMRLDLLERMSRWQPRVFAGVDAPDFNLQLECWLRSRGVRTAHFISPSIWAWRRERIDLIRKAVDHMLLVFPFEKAIYDQAGIASTYVGHPLADRIPLTVDVAAARRALGLREDRLTVALAPGSRGSEVKAMGEDFIRAALWLHERRRDVQFVLPAAGEALYERLRTTLATMRLPTDFDLTLSQGRSHEAFAAADAVLVASGTATLEVALFRKPMVIAYRMPRLSYLWMRNKGYLPWIGLPNILAGESLVPELIQDQATPAALGAALLGFIDDDRARDRLQSRFARMHHDLRCGCAARAAQVLLELGEGAHGAP